MAKSLNNYRTTTPERLLGCLTFAALLILWSVVAFAWPGARRALIEQIPRSAASLPDLFFLSDPKSVLLALGGLAIHGEFWKHLLATVGKSLLAFGIAAFGGSILGWLMATRRAGERLLLPSVEVVRSIPPISLLPVFLLLAGVGWTLSVWLATFGAFWPVTIAAFYAVKSVEPTTVEMGRNLGLNSRQLARHIQIPLAMPGLFTGLRIALPIALILVIVAEMTAGAPLGLGAAADYAKRSFRFDEMIAWIIATAFVGWGLNHALLVVQRRILFWHPSFRTEKEGV